MPSKWRVSPPFRTPPDRIRETYAAIAAEFRTEFYRGDISTTDYLSHTAAEHELTVAEVLDAIGGKAMATRIAYGWRER